MIIMPIGFATVPSLTPAERQLVNSNQDENNYRRQQMMNGQYITMSINGGSTICGLASMVIHQ